MNRARKIIFGCNAQLQIWRKRYSLQIAKCSVIYNGVDIDAFSPVVPGLTNAAGSACGIDLGPDDFAIGAVGKFRPEKNHVELVTALAQLQASIPSAKLVIVGEGEEQDRILQKIRDLNLENRVILPGRLHDVRPVLMAIDVYVQPSISETFSNAALEAMAVGKAVVLSDTGGTREMVEFGATGFFYATGDIDSLVSILAQLAKDRDALRKVGEQARQSVVERFSFAKMVTDYERVLGDEGG